METALGSSIEEVEELSARHSTCLTEAVRSTLPDRLKMLDSALQELKKKNDRCEEAEAHLNQVKELAK